MFDISGAIFNLCKNLESKSGLEACSFFCGGKGHVCVVGLFWRHWASVLDDFRVNGCAKNKAKIDFEASDGTHGSPKGLPESPRVAFWLILGSC